MSDEKLPGEEKTVDGDVVPNPDSAPVAGLEREDAQGKVCFKKGRVFFARSNWHRESLGRRLVKTGVISEKQLRQALGRHHGQAQGRAPPPSGGR